MLSHAFVVHCVGSNCCDELITHTGGVCVSNCL